MICHFCETEKATSFIYLNGSKKIAFAACPKCPVTNPNPGQDVPRGARTRGNIPSGSRPRVASFLVQ